MPETLTYSEQTGPEGQKDYRTIVTESGSAYINEILEECRNNYAEPRAQGVQRRIEECEEMIAQLPNGHYFDILSGVLHQSSLYSILRGALTELEGSIPKLEGPIYESDYLKDCKRRAELLKRAVEAMEQSPEFQRHSDR